MVYLPREYKDLYPAKKNKYNARKTIVDGHTFDSKKEAKRYHTLKFMQHCGVISDLELQPKYILQEKFVHKGESYRQISYSADFRYKKGSETWVEDTKSKITAKKRDYVIRKKLLLKQHPELNFIET